MERGKHSKIWSYTNCDDPNWLRSYLSQTEGLVEKNISTNTTPLKYYMYENNMTCFDICLEHVKNINHQDSMGKTILHHACVRQGLWIVNYVIKILRKMGNPNIPDNEEECLGRTPLHCSILYNPDLYYLV